MPPTVGTTLEPELVVYACPGRVCPCELSPPPEPMSSTYGSMSFGPPLWREEPALDMVENGGREEGAESRSSEEDLRWRRPRPALACPRPFGRRKKSAPSVPATSPAMRVPIATPATPPLESPPLPLPGLCVCVSASRRAAELGMSAVGGEGLHKREVFLLDEACCRATAGAVNGSLGVGHTRGV